MAVGQQHRRVVCPEGLAGYRQLPGGVSKRAICPVWKSADPDDPSRFPPWRRILDAPTDAPAAMNIVASDWVKEWDDYSQALDEHRITIASSAIEFRPINPMLRLPSQSVQVSGNQEVKLNVGMLMPHLRSLEDRTATIYISNDGGPVLVHSGFSKFAIMPLRDSIG